MRTFNLALPPVEGGNYSLSLRHGALPATVFSLTFISKPEVTVMQGPIIVRPVVQTPGCPVMQAKVDFSAQQCDSVVLTPHSSGAPITRRRPNGSSPCGSWTDSVMLNVTCPTDTVTIVPMLGLFAGVSKDLSIVVDSTNFYKTVTIWPTPITALRVDATETDRTGRRSPLSTFTVTTGTGQKTMNVPECGKVSVTVRRIIEEGNGLPTGNTIEFNYGSCGGDYTWSN